MERKTCENVGPWHRAMTLQDQSRRCLSSGACGLFGPTRLDGDGVDHFRSRSAHSGFVIVGTHACMVDRDVNSRVPRRRNFFVFAGRFHGADSVSASMVVVAIHDAHSRANLRGEGERKIWVRIESMGSLDLAWACIFSGSG